MTLKLNQRLLPFLTVTALLMASTEAAQLQSNPRGTLGGHAQLPSELSPLQREVIDGLSNPTIRSNAEMLEHHNSCIDGDFSNLEENAVKKGIWPPADVYCEATTERVLMDGDAHKLYEYYISTIRPGVPAGSPLVVIIDSDTKVPTNSENLPITIAFKAAFSQPGESMTLNFNDAVDFSLNSRIILDASIIAGFEGKIKPGPLLSEQQVQDIAQKAYDPTSLLPTPTPSQIESAGVQLGQQMRSRHANR